MKLQYYGYHIMADIGYFKHLKGSEAIIEINSAHISNWFAQKLYSLHGELLKITEKNRKICIFFKITENIEKITKVEKVVLS